MPAIPQPIYATQHFYLTYDTNPLTKIASVALDLTPSLPSPTHTITGYLTQIRWQPTGQTATVTAGTTPTPVIANIDRSVPGTVLVLGIVTDTNPNPTLNSSYNDHRPSQNGATANWGRGPYAGVGPVATQLAYIHVLLPNGHLKPAKYERDWAELPGSLYELIDHVDQMWGSVSSIMGGDGYFDNLYELTAGHEIHINNNLDLQPGVGIRFTTTSPLTSALLQANATPTEAATLVGTNSDIRIQTTPFGSTATVALEMVGEVARFVRTGLFTTPWLVEMPSLQTSAIHATTLAGITVYGGPFRVTTRVETDELRAYAGTEVLLTAAHDLRKPSNSRILLGNGASAGWLLNLFSSNQLPTIAALDASATNSVFLVANGVTGTVGVNRSLAYTAPWFATRNIQTEEVLPFTAANGVIVNATRIWQGGLYQALGGTPAAPPYAIVSPPSLVAHVGAPASITAFAWDNLDLFSTPDGTYAHPSGVYCITYEAMVTSTAGNNRQFRFVLRDIAVSATLTTAASAVINGAQTYNIKLILYVNPTALGFDVTGGFTVVANTNTTRAVDIPPFFWTAGSRGLAISFQGNVGTGGTLTKRVAYCDHKRRVNLPAFV